MSDWCDFPRFVCSCQPQPSKFREDCYWYDEERDMGARIPFCKARDIYPLEKCYIDCMHYHNKSKPTNADTLRGLSDDKLLYRIMYIHRRLNKDISVLDVLNWLKARSGTDFPSQEIWDN